MHIMEAAAKQGDDFLIKRVNFYSDFIHVRAFFGQFHKLSMVDKAGFKQRGTKSFSCSIAYGVEIKLNSILMRIGNCSLLPKSCFHYYCPNSVMRILFVDDLRDSRELFRIAFSMHGHSVELSANGREAVDAVQDNE